MSHHHHHHHGRPRLGTSWPVAAGCVAVLFAYGAIDGFANYRVYFHGLQGQGVVTAYHADDDVTVLRVEGRVCAVSGRFGHVGAILPVAFPHAHPGSCIVRQLGTFHWSLGAMLSSSAVMALIFAWQRGMFTPKKKG